MPREFAAVNVAIWNDPEFRALPPAAQHLYILLWTSPGLSYCGTHDWRPGRLAALSEGFTAEHIATVGACLTARHFLVTDDDTEEVLVRSWARFDGLMKQPRMAVSYANAYSQVTSKTIRAVLAYETRKIKEESPELACWDDRRVAEILGHPTASAKDLALPDDPFGDSVGGSFALGLPQTPTSVCPKVWDTATPAPAPAPNSLLPGTPVATDVAGDRFEEFWDAYGKKVDRKTAEKKWLLALKKPGVTADGIVAAVGGYRDWTVREYGDLKYLMDPSKWLNGERWKDERKAPLQLLPSGEVDVSKLPPVEETWMRRRPKQ